MKTNREIPDAALTQHLAVLGKTGSGKSSTLRLIVERLLDREEPVCIIDPKGDWWGLKSSSDGEKPGYPVVIFGGERGDVPINAHAGAAVAELVATGNRPCIIDLGGWTVGDRTKFFIDFAHALFRLSKSPRYLVIDEVHNFAPQGRVQDPQAGKMLHWANRLASEGRGKGITIFSASQRPQKVHKDFLTCSETLIAMRVIHPLDRGAIKDWIDGCPDPVAGKKVLDSLAGMTRGTGWVWSPEIGFGPQMIVFPKFITYDSFRAPVGGDAGPLPGWADVDLEAVKDKLANVIAEAEENDVGALKRKIKLLERQSGHTSAELAAEYTRGRADGFDAGIIKALQITTPALNNTHTLILETIERLKACKPEAGDIEFVRSTDICNFTLGADPSFVPHSSAREPVAKITEWKRPGEAKMGKCERLILTALAQHPQGRSKVQVAVLTGYAKNGGSFNNALGALRSRGLIEGRGENLTITKAGREALGPYTLLPTGKALLEHWKSQLGKAERAILVAAASVYPDASSKKTLGDMTGYEPNGGSFNNALGRLRTLELIVGRGEIRASDNLF